MRDVFSPVSAMIESRIKSGSCLIVAIDGRCASGKTTLALKLKEKFGCSVIHMDHFFLRPAQRTKERLDTPGGNVDYDRVLQEVLIPLKEGKDVSYCPYDCKSGTLSAPIRVDKGDIIIIEGAYSCHPALWDYYDLRLFLTTDCDTQFKRIIAREPASKTEDFRTKWIPLEEKYFSAYDIENRCDKSFTTSDDGHF